MRLINTLASLFITLAATSTSFAADVYLLGHQDGISMILFSGAIRSGDLEKVEASYKEAFKRSNAVYLMLSSPGGSVDEAMRIGDFLEEKSIGALVPSTVGQCISACVLILAGGDDKGVKGKVGIHRPFISDVSVGGAQGAKTLGKYIETIKTYLDRKGIAPSLADDMFSIPPEKVKYLSAEDLTRYRLDQRNYLKQEASDVEIAKAHGLTRQEFIRKKNQMELECSGMPSDQMLACTKRIMGPRPVN